MLTVEVPRRLIDVAAILTVELRQIGIVDKALASHSRGQGSNPAETRCKSKNVENFLSRL